MKRGLLHTEGLPKYFLYTIFTILNKIFLLHKIFCCGFKKQSQRQLIYIVRLVKIKKLTLAVLEDETLQWEVESCDPKHIVLRVSFGQPVKEHGMLRKPTEIAWEVQRTWRFENPLPFPAYHKSQNIMNHSRSLIYDHLSLELNDIVLIF